MNQGHAGHTVFSNIKSVLVVMSSRATAFDQSALRNFITHSYPGSAVFFISTSGDPVGVVGPNHVDLVIDFTEPNARQGFFFAFQMRKRSNFAVGRNTGWFYRRARYDRIYDDAADAKKPTDYLDGERWAQKKVLELAGVPVIQQGGLTPDRSKEIALELPPMRTQ